MEPKKVTSPTSDRGWVFDIRRYSVHDGPGIRTTVFLKGCPLDCWWCHNPESQSPTMELLLRPERCVRCGACLPVCPVGAAVPAADGFSTQADLCRLCGECVSACPGEAREMAGREMTVAQVVAEIERDIPFYDESGGGVTFSGGEPFAQPAFLRALLEACRTREIHTAIDTSGYVDWPVLDSIRPLTGLFLYDLKLIDDARHHAYTGVSNRRILENLRALLELGHPVILRVPLIPGVSAEMENICRLGELVAGLPGRVRIDLLPYHTAAAAKYRRMHRPYRLDGAVPPSREEQEELAGVLAGYGLEVHLGG